jgi:hypothetical protein
MVKKMRIIGSGSIDPIKKFINWNTNQFVTVANGSKMRIVGSGSIDLFSRNISNVLYVKNCPTNLLSIGKIMQELNCEIIFSSKSVIFQEWKSKNVISEGFLENGLYSINEEKYNFFGNKRRRVGALFSIGESVIRPTKY